MKDGHDGVVALNLNLSTEGESGLDHCYCEAMVTDQEAISTPSRQTMCRLPFGDTRPISGGPSFRWFAMGMPGGQLRRFLGLDANLCHVAELDIGEVTPVGPRLLTCVMRSHNSTILCGASMNPIQEHTVVETKYQTSPRIEAYYEVTRGDLQS